MRVLRDYQVDAIEHAAGRLLAGDRRVPNVLATGLGKGHPLDTEVPTPHGFRRWGNLEVGDYVYGRNGAPVRVSGVFDRGVLPTYRVTFSDESSVEVDADHIWHVRDSGQSYRPWGNVTTAELARVALKRSRGWRFHIPMTVPVGGPATTLPLDPYTVGALVSNGSMTSRYGVQLTTPDVAVAARIAAAGISVKAVNDSTPGVCPRYYLAGIDDVTRQLGMRAYSTEKRIPYAYLTAHREARTALLHGLMDGDGGGRDATRRSVAYFTSSPFLAEDVSQLVTSLGGTGIVKRYDRGAKGIEYAVRILMPSTVPAFSTARKDDAGSASVRNLQPKRAIVSIEQVGSKEIRCIKVDAPDSLYLITRQHIVTHNTEIFTDPTLLDTYLNATKRVLIIVHTDELADQAAKKARRNNPGRTVGIVMGTSNQVTAQIIIASRQTLGHPTGGPRRLASIHRVGLIIIDECHHALRSNTYGKILEHFGCFDDASPTAPHVLGYTATLVRGDKGKLSTVWQDGKLFTRDILFGIRRGYLLDVRGKRVVVDGLDMKNVRISGGDFRDSDVADELERTFAPEVVAAAYVEHAEGRKGIAFWPLVATAEHGARAFNEAGIRSEVIHGRIQDLPKRERRALLQRLHTGETRVVHGVGVLTEGFDEPTVDVVVIARPTRSAGLYQQMVGRVLRPDLTIAPEQRQKALILDVVGAGARHDLRSLVDLAPERDFLEHDDDEFSLLELDTELETWVEEEIGQGGGGFEDEPDYDGATEIKEFDPLGRDRMWSKTRGGTYFMMAGTVGYVFLVESVSGDPGNWDVVMCSKVSYPVGTLSPWMKGTDYVDLPMDIALAEAEALAIEVGGHGTKSLTGRKSKWRREEPSPAQKGKAVSHGVWVDGMSKGECSAAIDQVQASFRIDPTVTMVRVRAQQA